jgi:cellulose synthase/poly-beta-1,6-N-acetylglucosamine synthase-like glycosyltransferase
MKISVIVPAFNEEQFLGKTLAQIKAAAGALANTGWGTELIVCDNNSTDGSLVSSSVLFAPVWVVRMLGGQTTLTAHALSSWRHT